MAHTEGHDMIVLGSHEESYLKGFSWARYMRRFSIFAKQPVLIVRQFREIRKVLIVYRGSDTDDAALNFVSSLLLPKSLN